MLYISIFNAKENISLDEINKERKEWYKKGKNKSFQKMCRRIDRFEIAGKSPLQIIFIMETDDPQALNILSHHFGREWISTTYPALQRDMYEAMEEDISIVGG